jgi:alpha-mannosidase
MLPAHHLLSQIPLRADSVASRLASSIWNSPVELQVHATAVVQRPISHEEAVKMPLRPCRAPEHWGRLFDQRWCRIQFEKKTDGRQWLTWRDQGEATLYLNGEPFFGFDVAHRHCLLPRGIREVWVEANCVQSAIWHHEASGLSPQGSLFEGAFLMLRNDSAWHVYHDMRCLLDVALALRQQEDATLLPEVAPGQTQPRVERHSPAYRRMLRWLDRASDRIDEGKLNDARKLLADAYAELREERSLMKVVLTGHAHIDLVWLWPERIGELKAVHTFSTVKRLMSEYPELRFAYSQPASYEAVRRRAPKLFTEVRKLMKSGRWQATGAMYVESDTLIACGEALLRSFLVGQDFFREIRGEPSPLAWLPDVFGYSACLPQMMRLAGVRSLFTTKLTWNMVNRFPYSSFVWRGNDGSEVLAHVTQDCGYNTSMRAAELKASSWGHQQADIHSEYLLPVGYGDGGGGPTAEMCERARRLGGLPGMPQVEWGHPEAFFERLERLRQELPVWTGECYFEAHRGTYTTHSEVKFAFRTLERALQVSEAVSCATGKLWNRGDTWKRLIFAQFHDYIPGSSVWDVYCEGVPELLSLADSETRKAIRTLETGSRTPCLFNPHAVEVVRWVRNPESGERIRVKLPPLSGSAIEAAVWESAAPAVVKDRVADNDLVHFRLGRHGWLERLRFNGVEVPFTGPAGALMLFCDRPAKFDAWDIDRHTLSNGRACDAKAEIDVIALPDRGGFKVRRAIGKNSRAEISYFLEPGSPLLHVEIELDWDEPDALLKFVVPTAFHATNARFGIPYGSILRPQIMNGLVSEAMWEVPFSRWLAVFDEREGNGLFAVTEAKYGATVRDGSVGISLVRSPKASGYDVRRIAWPPALSRVKGPGEHTDLGRHFIRLAFGRYHTSLAREEHPASLADTLFTEPVAYSGRPAASPIESMQGAETVIPGWAQPLDRESWVLRLHEVAGQPGTLSLNTADGWVAARCDASGETSEKGRTKLTLEVKPYEIASVLFRKQQETRRKRTGRF